jgi:hypothetical protein
MTALEQTRKSSNREQADLVRAQESLKLEKVLLRRPRVLLSVKISCLT